MVWHSALLTKLSSDGIQGNLHSWLAEFLSCRSQRVALHGIHSPLFLSWLEFLKVVFWAQCFFSFSTLISPILWKILFFSLLMTPPSCHTICHPSDRQAAASSLSAVEDKITSWSNTWNMSSFNPDKSHTLTMSLQKDCLEHPPPHLLLNNPLEEILSFKLLGLTICHDLS